MVVLKGLLWGPAGVSHASALCCLQVLLAQTEYQLPRLTRMWTHLDRVTGGGQVKGAGAQLRGVHARGKHCGRKQAVSQFCHASPCVRAGAGEKQIEIDKRLLRDRAGALRKELESVRTHRR